MGQPRSERGLGIALVISAAIAWSTAPFFTRLLPFDPWTILFWRGVFGGSLISVFLVLMQGRGALRQLVAPGRGGLLVASLSTLGMVSFIPALQMTKVMNVAVLISTQPFVAAALAWLWLGEAVTWRTLIASLVAFGGVAITVGGIEAGADVGGVALSCFMVLAISAMTVVIRRYQETSMVAAAALSNFLGSLVSLPFAHDLVHIDSANLAILAMFGCFQVALGLTFYMLGSRLLPSSQASLIATLETPLMPFWIWIAFREIPAVHALVGGALVIGAVVADIAVDARSRDRS
ncbi:MULTISPECIES: DMT family transporter [unclassified Bradyrhizobium]|jgi:drug/metabolite transporter (DMT)-like permease|uniref:DMT family transporter n=1 Tax=unclassified Bradyrhizobium TaxID=2631580 RepID=UPI001FF92CC8|nr:MULTISPECIES: DMT family transporter [unclassified Bradyrhizobium]MCK1323233.1 DMT family transporter [Bradyrhizobium sp. 156]MCK1354525.1 DMT family transporter [Bradyrhizobium sp. CW7]MCK1415775.1 DMT family transporter [Bradyrhizobium sp. CW4]MCK1501348.1 DMT family transporter [Bradyrhizobium sp. 188]MCK1526017.1 DMT family transporter [Bradyrhizobium sp. 17]